MLPLLFIYFFNFFSPATLVNAVAGVLPTVHPYMSLFYSLMVCFVPVGIKIMVLAPKNWYDNKQPRRMLLPGGKIASDEWLSRVQSSHLNVLENLPLFAAGVIACVTAGVPLQTVSDIATYYNVVSALYILVFISPINNLTDGNARSLFFATRLATQAKLFYIAAQAAGKM